MKKWIDECVPEILRTWITETACPMLVTMPDGKICWANNAFEDLVEYNLEEIEYKQIGWDDLTVDHSDVAIDLDMSKKIERGEKTEYSLFKSYKSKNNKLIPVIVHVLRYPQRGPFEFCLVSITPTNNQINSVSEQIESIRSDMIKLVEAVSSYSENSEERSLLYKYIRVYEKSPIPVLLITLIIGSLLFGDRVTELYKSFSNGFKNEPQIIYIKENK